MSEKKKINPKLTLDVLLSMSPIVHDRDLVKIASRHFFLSHVKSQANVKDVFFSTAQKPDERLTEKVHYGWFDVRRFACLFVCQTICKLQDEYKMYALLDEYKIESELNALYSSPHWKKVGFSLYTTLFQELVKDEKSKVPFSAFLADDPERWAQRLSERVRERQWVYANLIHPVVQGKCTEEEYNRDLNILFIKLHLLDPASVMSTFDYLHKALPDLNLELVTTNYLGGALDTDQIKPDIISALQRPTYPAKGHRLSLNEIEVFYGLEVLDFITQEAKERGLWTGKDPDNKRVSPLKERCVVM